MKYVWETELVQNRAGNWVDQLHLKATFAKDLATRTSGLDYWKHTVAWVYKIKDRKWDCQFVNHNGSKTFPTKKAAMAYAVAIVALED